MALKKPDIIIFDMDGTAVRHINPRLLHVLEWLDNLSYKCSKFFSWIFKRGARGPIVPEWHTDSKRKPRLLVHRAIHKFRRKPVEQIVEPCPGLYELLELLEENNIPIALVSNGLGKGYGHDVLKKFELDSYFKTTVFREDITHSKPNPEPILLALKRMNIQIKSDNIIWYIGDRHKDVIAALSASEHVEGTVQPVAFAFNAAMAVLEKNVGQDHIIMSFHDIYDHLKPILEIPAEKKTIPEASAPPPLTHSASY